VVLRIKNLLQTRSLHLQLQGQNQRLDQKVHERTAELEATQVEILERLALAGEYRDDDTGEHTKRVGQTCARIAEALGWSATDVELIRRAAPLHDVGKIAISDLILLKPGKLTTEEFETMKTHTTLGAKMLSGGRFPLLQLAEQIALTHHERWEGGGYIGICGEEIPIAGRIVTVADVFDALTSERPYKKAWPLEEALAEIQRQSGHQFDPRVVDAFLKIV
jgi:putative two-component system response regulator